MKFLLVFTNFQNDLIQGTGDISKFALSRALALAVARARLTAGASRLVKQARPQRRESTWLGELVNIMALAGSPGPQVSTLRYKTKNVNPSQFGDDDDGGHSPFKDSTDKKALP